jgi:SAM-dependent methyltransferase
MGLYQKYILPRAIGIACGIRSIERQREKIVPLAQGDILEIGIGTGLNLAHYDPQKVEKIIGLDPSEDTWRAGKVVPEDLPFDFEFLPVSAEKLPFNNGSFDTVVVTFSLCTIPDPLAALREMRRVLRPDGRLLFGEHGLAPEPGVEKWQHRLDPLWSQFSGGCHLDRDIPGLIREAGFHISKLEQMYLPGWKVFSYHYWGQAVLEG